MRKPKFNFKAALTSMLERIGAKPSSTFYELMLETKAGLLYLAPYEDWLATRFDSATKAAEVVTCGSLNRFSGKWNWHFVAPTQKDVDYLEEQLKALLPEAIA